MKICKSVCPWVKAFGVVVLFLGGLGVLAVGINHSIYIALFVLLAGAGFLTKQVKESFFS